MCQYSSKPDGLATPWHMVHLGTRAVGGAGLVMAEATAVQPEGRISQWDQGIWSDAHVDALRPITKFIDSAGSVPAIQLAHAGRKASHAAPWIGSGLLSEDGEGWKPVAPSALPFDEDYAIPAELSEQEISDIVQAFANAAVRSVDAGYKVIELHFAHGYLACEFLSPISNQRHDKYGGSLKNRAAFPLETITAVRNAIPESMPLFARVSASEYVKGGWDLDQSIQLSKWMNDLGVDLVDCSSGGNSPNQLLPIPVANPSTATAPGYQVAFASEIRKQTGILTGAVGLITEAQHAEEILSKGDADVIFIGRELLRNPYWPLYAKAQLDGIATWPDQYARSAFDGSYTGLSM